MFSLKLNDIILRLCKVEATLWSQTTNGVENTQHTTFVSGFWTIETSSKYTTAPRLFTHSSLPSDYPLELVKSSFEFHLATCIILVTITHLSTYSSWYPLSQWDTGFWISINMLKVTHSAFLNRLGLWPIQKVSFFVQNH